MNQRQAIEDRFRGIQDRITTELAKIDGLGFREDNWTYPAGSGGGRTRVMEFGNVFEKAGVNFSAISGPKMPAAALKASGETDDTPFFATGVSLVIHPKNPYVPTVHMNIRYFSAGANDKRWWFGGGIDLTPYYPNLDQVVDFHRQLKHTCDIFQPEWYSQFKSQCDAYFYLPHRQETRGVGGIFFDQIQHDFVEAFAFTGAVGDCFIPAYAPIVLANKDFPYGERERQFQRYRRGRYVEFNLLFDRGTKFGIESHGRTESILMSLPPEVHWRYDYTPEPGSPEAALADFLAPRDWI